MTLNQPEKALKPNWLTSIIEPIAGGNLLQKVKSFIYIPMLAAVIDAPSNGQNSLGQGQKQGALQIALKSGLSNCHMISINPGGAHGRLG